MVRRLDQVSLLFRDISDGGLVQGHRSLRDVGEPQGIDANEAEQLLDLSDETESFIARESFDLPTIHLVGTECAAESAVDQAASQVGRDLSEGVIVVEQQRLQQGSLQAQVVECPGESTISG
jgi:hypothetical protein